MPLESERKVFDQNIDSWRQSHKDQFVVIKDSQVIGFFSSLQEAFDAGSEQFGLDDFLLEQIVDRNSVNVTFLGLTA